MNRKTDKYLLAQTFLKVAIYLAISHTVTLFSAKLPICINLHEFLTFFFDPNGRRQLQDWKQYQNNPLKFHVFSFQIVHFLAHIFYDQTHICKCSKNLFGVKRQKDRLLLEFYRLAVWSERRCCVHPPMLLVASPASSSYVTIRYGSSSYRVANRGDEKSRPHVKKSSHKMSWERGIIFEQLFVDFSR